MPGIHQVVGSLLLLAAAGDLHAASVSASFGVSIIIVRPCVIRPNDPVLRGLSLEVACASNGALPLIVVDRPPPKPPSTVTADEKARVVTIIY